MMRSIVVAVLLAGLSTGSALSQAPLPPGVFPGTPDLKTAPAGRYTIDPDHAAVIAKVSHIGYAFSVFRFNAVDGALIWDPAKPSASKLVAKVATASITTPVAGFAKQLAGDEYLKSTAYPDATFVSSTFTARDATHGTVEGALSLLGKTKPVAFDVVLIGAGKGFMGHPRIGIEATGQISPKDFGLNPVFGTPIRIEIDAEFTRGS